jgi:hypothetical protein
MQMIPERRPPSLLPGTCVRVLGVASLGVDDPEAVSAIGERGVVIASATPMTDGSGWNLGVWLHDRQEVWGFDEDELEVIDRDQAMVEQAPTHDLGEPWRDTIHVSLGFETWNETESPRWLGRVVEWLGEHLAAAEVTLRVPESDDPKIGDINLYPSRHPADVLREQFSVPGFGIWATAHDDGWFADFTWSGQSPLLGASDTGSIKTAWIELEAWERPQKREWRFDGTPSSNARP